MTCSSLLVACSQPGAAPRPLTETVWHLEVDNAPVIGEPGAAAVTYLGDVDLGLGDDDEFEVIQLTAPAGDGLVHVRLQQLHRGVPVLGSEIAVHADATTFLGYSGTVTRGLAGLDVTPAIDANAAVAAADEHLSAALGAPITYPEPTPRLVIQPRDGDEAELDWQIELDLEPAPGRLPGRWFYLVDAVTGEVHEAYDGLTTDEIVVEQASGPGGNAKVSRTWSAQLDVVRHFDQEHPDGQYTMLSPDLWTCDGHRSKTDFATVTAPALDGFTDPAANDAHGFAEITLAMMRQWMGQRTASVGGTGLLVSVVHYDDNYGGAFFNGGKSGGTLFFGDGGSDFYPLSGSLDVVAHEIHHQFTAAHSNLVYKSMSGAMNESFSDVGGTLAEFFQEGAAADFLLAEDVSKNKEALRWMCDPPKDGASIDHTTRWVPEHKVGEYTVWGTDVHFGSGIGNKAFCLAVGRQEATGASLVDAVRSMGQVWYQANTAFWTSESTFSQACQGTVDAARSLGRDGQTISAIQQSWADVGAYCESGEGLACKLNGTCDAAAGETCFSCAADCGACIEKCGPWQRAKCTLGIGDCTQCGDDGTCGDGVCGASETDATCGQDCGCRAPGNSCGSVAAYGCWCDASCTERGDCCADASVCQ